MYVCIYVHTRVSFDSVSNVLISTSVKICSTSLLKLLPLEKFFICCRKNADMLRTSFKAATASGRDFASEIRFRIERDILFSSLNFCLYA